MRRLLALACGLALGCGGPRQLERAGTVEGTAVLPDGIGGDVYLFLFGRGQGPPQGQGLPRYVTAISRSRLASGDGHFVFANVEPNPYRLWAFLDSDRGFVPEVEVLAQPGARDRRSGDLELNLQPGQRLGAEVAIDEVLRWEPPAFYVAGAPPLTVLPDQPTSLITLDLRSYAHFGFDQDRSGFVVSLADANGDGEPEDGDGDGIFDLFPRLLLRYAPRPGQWRPLSQSGKEGEVIVPLAFNPGPFLAALEGDVGAELLVTQLTAAYLPLAQAITEEPGPGTVITQLSAIPPGEYELWVVSEAGQFWKLPNALGEAGESTRSGPRPIVDQAARFEIVRN